MARIAFTADKAAESTGAGGGKFPPKIRGFYALQICEASDGLRTKATAKNPNVPYTNFRLEVATDDERGALGAHVYHNVTWIPRGTEEKAKAGHGMAVHWLHACKMPFDGAFNFDEQDFLKPEHAMIHALLEIEEYEKAGTQPGQVFINERFVIWEVYTPEHPQPDELPPAPKKKEVRPAGVPAGAAAGSGAGAAAGSGQSDEVPF
jgi:hypothetical protein